MAGPLPEFREGRRRQVWQLLSGWDVANHAKARVFLQKHIIIAQPLTQWGNRICEGEIDIAEDESVIGVSRVGVTCRIKLQTKSSLGLQTHAVCGI